MKKLFLLTLVMCLISSIGFSQKIITNHIDKFTNNKVIETSFEKIATDNRNVYKGMLLKSISISFNYLNNIDILHIKWNSNIILSIDKDSEIIFLDNNGNKYIFKTIDYCIAGIGNGSIGFIGSALYGLDIRLIGDFSVLENIIVTDLRIYTTDGFCDFKIDKKSPETISNLYKLYKSSK